MNPRSDVFNCDCVEYMSTLPDKYFSLAIADPNYGIGISSNPVRQKHAKKNWDNNTPDNTFFQELFRVSKNQIIWGGNYFDLPPTKGFIVWDKKQSIDFTLAMCEYAWTSFDKPAKMFRQHVASNGEDKIHPTQKSVALYAWILKYYAQDGDTIFDPMIGSGSSRIAAYRLGYDFYGCELDKDYFDAQEKRFKESCLGEIKVGNKTIKQLTLF